MGDLLRPLPRRRRALRRRPIERLSANPGRAAGGDDRPSGATRGREFPRAVHSGGARGSPCQLGLGGASRRAEAPRLLEQLGRLEGRGQGSRHTAGGARRRRFLRAPAGVRQRPAGRCFERAASVRLRAAGDDRPRR